MRYLLVILFLGACSQVTEPELYQVNEVIQGSTFGGVWESCALQEDYDNPPHFAVYSTVHWDSTGLNYADNQHERLREAYTTTDSVFLCFDPSMPGKAMKFYVYIFNHTPTI